MTICCGDLRDLADDDMSKVTLVKVFLNGY
jgi:hypothetical protein